MGIKKQYTVEELQSILKEVRATYGLTDQEISEKVNRNKGYIAQTLSRKSVSPLLIEDIKRMFSDAGKVSTPSDNDALLAVVVDRLSKNKVKQIKPHKKQIKSCVTS